MVAAAAGVPVLVCCESCKFHERVQLDSICANELGDAEVTKRMNARLSLSPFPRPPFQYLPPFLSLRRLSPCPAALMCAICWAG